jgi:CHASE3 domain sensor protein
MNSGRTESDKPVSMKLSLERKLVAAVSVALVSILGLGILQYRSARRLTEDSQRVSHTHDVLRELADTRSALNRSDAATQRFLVTGDTNDIRPYAQAISLLHEDLRKRRRTTVLTNSGIDYAA